MTLFWSRSNDNDAFHVLFGAVFLLVHALMMLFKKYPYCGAFRAFPDSEKAVCRRVSK